VTRPPLLDDVERYYSQKVQEHGPTPAGADWKDEASQELRFEQLLRGWGGAPFSLVDYGCGYGALLAFARRRAYEVNYTGYDVSALMIAHARERFPDAQFVTAQDDLRPADLAVASGVFNVRLQTGVDQWRGYVDDTVRRLDELGRRGFAFNVLTSYSDPERMRDDLYYADPLYYFDLCKRHYSRHVALLHDYGLWEFTILVRKDVG
jgi:SAM-dependent methyltransferase